MMKNSRSVPDVPGLCRALCRVFRSCAGCAGSPIGVRVTHKRKTTHTKKHGLMCIYTRHTRHTRHMLDSYTFFHITPGTRYGTPGTDTPMHAPDSLIYSLKGKKMGETPKALAPATSRTIRCTPENAGEMQQMVKQWPELHALVQQLQAQNLFPGLRSLSVTLTGPQSFVDGGIDAVNQLNAPKRD